MNIDAQELQWTAQFIVTPGSIVGGRLQGDKILLPPTALEQLLSAAPIITDDSRPGHTPNSAFDPFNPHSYAVERHARAQSQFRQQQLPHPLTFRLVNPSNGRVVYAGIQEFSAEEGQAGLSSFLSHALGYDSDHVNGTLQNGVHDESIEGGENLELNPLSKITVQFKPLLKGTYVKLRPLEAGYDPDDWKALLEQHLRTSFTTLTKGELLKVPAGRSTNGQTTEFSFLIDEFQPQGDGICVIDTDLEVDIEALNEEQARETLKRIAAKIQTAPGTKDGSSKGGDLLLLVEQIGQVRESEYVDYQIPSWDRSRGLEIEVSAPEDQDAALDVFVSPFHTRQRHRPREDAHVLAEFGGRMPKRIKLSQTNAELENADAVWVSVHAPGTEGNSRVHSFSIKAVPYDAEKSHESEAITEQQADEVTCDNCHQFIPQRTLMLHQNFCYRNNVWCSKGCNQVFQKRSEAWQLHWHCPKDTAYGIGQAQQERHDSVFHQTYECPSCGTVAQSLPQLASHRTTVCPGKIILCSFCHLEVPQEGDPNIPNAEALLSGLTPHELADGARTTECHLCEKIVRLRDMATHLKFHNLERLRRDIPRLCRNELCGRTLDGVGKNGDTRAGARMGQGPGNDIGLCSVCYGPLYVSMYDPEGRALKRRIERKYLSQLLTGCGHSWCRNSYCKTGRQNSGVEPAAASIATKDALPMIKPFTDAITSKAASQPLHFCVDEASQRRRELAALIQAEEQRHPGSTGYSLPWCIAGLEAESNDIGKARDWLHNFAPQIGEGP